MMKSKSAKKYWSLAAFAFLALSAFALSAPSAQAWGPWGNWAPAGTFSNCSGSAGNGTELACTGRGASVGALLAAYTPSGSCGQQTEALGSPKLSNGTFFSVIANQVRSASRVAPITFTHAICHCQYRLCGPD